MIKRWVQLKKDKECHACEREMKKGDNALYWCCQQEETHLLYSDHWCPQCAEWAEEVNKCGEWVYSGDFLERRLEQEDEVR